ncbi:hypothetical protein [Azospirillum sp.]|uniref:hypothetical protein n=1 Tax=Azospirillum sp. TaxID=34012 RepID=UPI002D220338|nr:hypothetical protein [Azospirillum sp.]HYD71132.1 hypothetical protein [Azospirillum sp.]HYH23206.1 hypothetical protein [Azospirillum sp.]
MTEAVLIHDDGGVRRLTLNRAEKMNALGTAMTRVLAATIVRWCVGRMSAFKIPRFIAFADEFPRSVTKREIERHKLKALPDDGAWDCKRHN